MKKRIVLCADDYGQAPAISQGICALVEKGRLSAVSCMVNGRDWERGAPLLHAISAHIDVGLHFNLTEGAALSAEWCAQYGQTLPRLASFLMRAFMRRWDVNLIKQECLAQIDRFLSAFGRLPDFIDGHQHIQQFPQVRDALLEVYESRFKKNHAYIRWSAVKPHWLSFLREPKKFVIYASGGATFEALLRAGRIPYNASFSGIYDFSLKSFPGQMGHFFKAISDKGLIMCHPGWLSHEGYDEINQARFEEYQYLMSEAFLKLCQDQQIELVRGRALF